MTLTVHCRRRFSPRIWIGFAACAGLFLSGCGSAKVNAGDNSGGKSASGSRGNQAVPVSVATAESRDVPVYLTGLGGVEAFNTVTIKSRVDGQLVQVAFREGQEVKKGDLLAVIDPRPFEVQLAQTQATLFKDQSAFHDAQINLTRFQDLYPQGVVSKQQLDTQSAQTAQLDAAVRSDQAQVDNAKLQLSYTRITAPVSGRLGLRLVDAGNMVHASDPTGLLVLTQVQPIAVVFTLPEENLPVVAKQMRKGTLSVEAYDRDDKTKIGTGKLLTIDNQIDPTTGTGKLKAVFDNSDRALWPNQFVNVKLLLEVQKGKTVIPAAAIQRGPSGSYVYVVKADPKAGKTVESRPITIALTQDELAIVAEGVSPGDVIVTDGQDKLQKGTPVNVPGNGGRSGMGTGMADKDGSSPPAGTAPNRHAAAGSAHGHHPPDAAGNGLQAQPSATADSTPTTGPGTSERANQHRR